MRRPAEIRLPQVGAIPFGAVECSSRPFRAHVCSPFAPHSAPRPTHASGSPDYARRWPINRSGPSRAMSTCLGAAVDVHVGLVQQRGGRAARGQPHRPALPGDNRGWVTDLVAPLAARSSRSPDLVGGMGPGAAWQLRIGLTAVVTGMTYLIVAMQRVTRDIQRASNDGQVTPSTMAAETRSAVRRRCRCGQLGRGGGRVR